MLQGLVRILNRFIKSFRKDSNTKLDKQILEIYQKIEQKQHSLINMIIKIKNYKDHCLIEFLNLMFNQKVLEQSISKIVSESRSIRNSAEFENSVYYSELLVYLKKTSELTEDEQIFDSQMIQSLQILTNNRQLLIRSLSWCIINNIVNADNSSKLDKYVDLYFG